MPQTDVFVTKKAQGSKLGLIQMETSAGVQLMEGTLPQAIDF